MELVLQRAVIKCGHDGKVSNLARQHWVKVDGSPVLVDDDPQGRSIVGCPNFGATMKPCTKTLKVNQGYRDWFRIDERRVVGADLDGLTDGTVPGTVHYGVRNPGQNFVAVTP
jgi:hypothetical protein